MVPVTAFFAGLLALIYILLALNIIRGRYALRLPLGDGGDNSMTRRIRAHANFAEYVPLALILMGLSEINGLSESFLTIVGWVLVLCRLSHAFSLSVWEVKNPMRIIFRQVGMVGTFGVILILAFKMVF